MCVLLPRPFLTLLIVKQSASHPFFHLLATQGLVDCPCLWADLSDVEGHVAQLRVAYRMHGDTVHIGRVPVPAVKVKPEYANDGHFGSTLASCSGNVSKRVYMVIFRLLHILFPTLDAWNRRSLEAGSLGMEVDADEERGGVFYSLQSVKSNEFSQMGLGGSGGDVILVKPNFLLGCLEAVRQRQVLRPGGVGDDIDDSNDRGSDIRGGDSSHHGSSDDSDVDEVPDHHVAADCLTSGRAMNIVFEERACLKTVRHLEDVFGLLSGVGSLDQYGTPLSSPERHRSFSFQSPAKKPLNTDKAMDLKLAISMIELGTTSNFRDGALFLQTACQSQRKAEYAVRRGAFKALVMSSSMMLASKVMGSVEQLSILTMTASQLLDKSSSAAAAERVLVREFGAALQRSVANPALLLHFLTAMIHRPDIKEAAIELKMYNALALMYIKKLPLLEPLADALVTPEAATRTGAVSATTHTTAVATNDSNNFMHGFVLTPTKIGKHGVSVPPLSLAAPDSAERVSHSPAGLTRATRRESDLANQVVKDTSRSLDKRIKKQNAGDELEHLAQALGESLVAKDLPSLIEYRRRLAQDNNALFSTCDSAQEDKWMLHQTASVADLRAHKILSGEDSTDGETNSVTSVSDVVLVASDDNCLGCTYDRSDEDGFSLDEQSLLEGVEGSVDLCPYLVNAMLAVHSHLPGCYDLDPDPSRLITADILSFPAHIYEGNLYVKSCLQLLTHISSSQSEPDHIFLVAVGNKLQSLISSRSFGSELSNNSLAYYLDICLEYVSMCTDASMSTIFSRTVLRPLTEIFAGLCSRTEPVDEWGEVMIVLLNTSLRILVKALDLCATNSARHEYLLRFFGGEDGGLMHLLRNVSTQTLLCDDYDLSSEAATELGEIEKNILMLFSSMVVLIGGAEPLDLGHQARLEVGDDVICRFMKGREPKLLTRTYCMQCFSFLILPGTFLIRFSLEDEIQTSRGDYRLSSRSIRLRNGVFGLLQSLFSAKDSPYIMDKELTDYYVRLHFIRFLKLYHNPNRDHQATFICRQHLSMLCTLAQAARKSQGSSASKRFQHLSVVGFFIKEMSLEYEALEFEVSRPYHRSESSYDVGSLLDRTLSQSATSARSSCASDSSVTEDGSEAGSRRGAAGLRISMVPPLSLSLSGGPFGRTRSSTVDKETLIPALAGVTSQSPHALTALAGRETPTDSATGKSSTWADGSDLDHRVLERQGTSMAISIGTPATPGMNGPDDVQLPLGFTFTGDLDEDVDRLEALALDDKSRDEFSDSSDNEAEYYSGASSMNEADQRSLQSQSTRPSTCLSPSQEQPSMSGVPKLSISSSMRSSLHRRNESAELLHAVEEESQMRKAGRSFLGDMERQALGNGKMQAVRFSLNTGTSLGSLSTHSVEEVSKMERERSSRLIYQDDELHILAIKLVLMLIIDADGQLHSSYCDRFPWERKMQNIPFILQHHLNADPTRHLLTRVESTVYESVGSFATTFLKVMCADYFRPGWYKSRSRISGVNGAYATVYRSNLPWWSSEKRCVLKVIDLPRHNHDRCSQVEFYSEVAIHQKLANHPRVCKLYDFGVDTSADALILVLEEFKCSLKQWRLRHDDRQWMRAPTYWAIFREIVVACMDVLEAGVVHFDIKSDNILLNPLDGVSEDAFWRGTMSGSRLQMLLKKSGSQPQLAFRVVLADFGESVFFPGGIEGAMNGCTQVARGTDLFKSPEQLLVGGAQIHQNGFDRRRRHHGAGAVSDVWSLGCLLYELFTGTTLFSDSDWLQLAARVTTPGTQLITPDKHALIAGIPEVGEMLSFMLVRDPSMRPTLADVLRKLDSLSFNDSQSGSDEHFPRNSPGSPKSGRSYSGRDVSGTRLCIAEDSALARGVVIDCLVHVSDKLGVCSVSEFARLKRCQTEKSRVIILSSAITMACTHWDHDTLREFPMRSIFSTPCLQHCLEISSANNASAVVYSCPQDISNAKAMSSWLKHALADARIWEGSVFIVSDEADVQTALLALALIACQDGIYKAMVAGSAAGALDRYLNPALMDVIVAAV